MKNSTTRRGFTLIEVILVIALILFLLKLFMPRYGSYMTRARQAEVSLYLSALYAAEQNYYITEGKYTDNLKLLDWTPPQKPYYTYGFAQNEESAYLGSAGAPLSALHESTCTSDQFTLCAAIPDTSKENHFDVWSITEKGEIRHH